MFDVIHRPFVVSADFRITNGCGELPIPAFAHNSMNFFLLMKCEQEILSQNTACTVYRDDIELGLSSTKLILYSTFHLNCKLCVLIFHEMSLFVLKYLDIFLHC